MSAVRSGSARAPLRACAITGSVLTLLPRLLLLPRPALPSMPLLPLSLRLLSCPGCREQLLPERTPVDAMCTQAVRLLERFTEIALRLRRTQSSYAVKTHGHCGYILRSIVSFVPTHGRVEQVPSCCQDCIAAHRSSRRRQAGI